MKKYINKAAALLGLISLPLCAQNVSVIQQGSNQYGNNIKNGSARFNAMAGAMGAMGGDISSVNVNPGGLGAYISSDLQLTLNSNKQTSTASLDGKSFVNDNNNGLGISHFGIVLSLGELDRDVKNLNFGFAYSNQSDNIFISTPGNNNIVFNHQTVGTSTTPPSLINQYTYEGHRYGTTSNVSKLNFAIGANINHKYYLGLSVNAHSAEVKQSDFFNFSTPATGNKLYAFDKAFTPFNEVSKGLGLSLGAIAKLSQEFRLGLALETPTGWEIQRTYNEVGTNYNEDRTFYSPAKGSLSASFIPTKNVAINADFIQELSKPSYSGDGPATTQLNNFYRDSYQLMSEFRLGAEYRIEAFRLRAGYAYSSSPHKNINTLAYNAQGAKTTQTFNNPYIGERNNYSAGIGYHLKSFYLDATYQNIQQNYSNVFFSGPHYSLNQTGAGFAGFNLDNTASIVSQIKQQQHLFMLTLGIKF